MDADLGCGLRDLGDNCVGNAGPPGGLFQRRGVVLCNVSDLVLALGVCARCIAHRELRRLAGGEQLQRGRERRDLVLVDGHLQRNVIR